MDEEETQTSSDTYGLETDVPVVGSIKKGISFICSGYC